eukprot:scaffold23370_cov120-Isochrysis_galbana.AAC.6
MSEAPLPKPQDHLLPERVGRERRVSGFWVDRVRIEEAKAGQGETDGDLARWSRGRPLCCAAINSNNNTVHSCTRTQCTKHASAARPTHRRTCARVAAVRIRHDAQDGHESMAPTIIVPPCSLALSRVRHVISIRFMTAPRCCAPVRPAHRRRPPSPPSAARRLGAGTQPTPYSRLASSAASHT